MSLRKHTNKELRKHRNHKTNYKAAFGVSLFWASLFLFILYGAFTLLGIV